MPYAAIFKAVAAGDYHALHISDDGQAEYTRYNRAHEVVARKQGRLSAGTITDLLANPATTGYFGLAKEYPRPNSRDKIEDVYYWAEVSDGDRAKSILAHEKTAPPELKEIITLNRFPRDNVVPIPCLRIESGRLPPEKDGPGQLRLHTVRMEKEQFVKDDEANNLLTVATCDPQNLTIQDELRTFLGHEIAMVVATEREVMQTIERHFDSESESVEKLVQALADDEELKEAISALENEKFSLTDAQALADSAPVRRLLNMVLLLAIKDHASDIHFEPFEDEFRI